MLPQGLVAAVLAVPAFPYLWLAHCVLMCLALRATLMPKPLHFARQHPLSTFLLGLAYVFAGGLVSLIFRNQSVLTVLTWSNKLYSFTVVWYLMFYSPWDMAPRLLAGLPVVPFLAAAQDWMRLGAVRAGVSLMLEQHPDSFLIPVVFASITSSGFMVVKYIEQLVLRPDRIFVIRHHATKTMVVAAGLLTARHQGWLMGLEEQQLYSTIVLATVSLRLFTSFVVKDWDPYSSLESQACRLLYGVPEDQQSQETEAKKTE